MTTKGSPSFLQFSDNLKRFRAREAELAQESAVRQAELHASIFEQSEPKTDSLTKAIATHRSRTPRGA
jgi:response regulator of citrate/malate metabolism